MSLEPLLLGSQLPDTLAAVIEFLLAPGPPVPDPMAQVRTDGG